MRSGMSGAFLLPTEKTRLSEQADHETLAKPAGTIPDRIIRFLSSRRLFANAGRARNAEAVP